MHGHRMLEQMTNIDRSIDQWPWSIVHNRRDPIQKHLSGTISSVIRSGQKNINVEKP